jgi:hypothetical protein
MALSTPAVSSDTRLCPYCGKPISTRLTRCPLCREEIQDVKFVGRAYSVEARQKMRRGLLYILLAAIAHYFAAGYSTFTLPVTIPPFVTMYLTPMLFLAGIAYELYGVVLYLKS